MTATIILETGVAIGIGVFTLGIGALMALTKSKKYFIGVTWDDNGKKGGIAFQADKNGFTGVLAGRLARITCGPNQPCQAKISDINMLVRVGGRNRTEKEYRTLLTNARFAVTRVLPAQGDLHVIEGVPKG